MYVCRLVLDGRRLGLKHEDGVVLKRRRRRSSSKIATVHRVVNQGTSFTNRGTQNFFVNVGSWFRRALDANSKFLLGGCSRFGPMSQTRHTGLLIVHAVQHR
jgi:hypothetical protein